MLIKLHGSKKYKHPYFLMTVKVAGESLEFFKENLMQKLVNLCIDRK